MLIGIDGNEANIKNRVGVNVYVYELLKNLQKLQEKGECNDNLIVYLKNNPLPDMPKETQNFKYKVIPGGGIWILTKLMPRLFLDSEKPDIFFSPSHYVPPFAPMPRMCSIMDLGYLEFSSQFTKFTFWQLKWWSAISIFVSRAVLAISENVKDDIVRHYQFAKDKIYVTPLGYDTSKFNLQIPEKDVRRVKNKYSIVTDYILYVGTLKPSKNIEGLIAAFKAVISNGQFSKSNLKLVIAGKKGWLYETIFQKVQKLGLEKDVIFTDFLDEKDKPALIKGARVFTLPSFWEGFGLDVLSAMACGVPTVVSNAGSLPEIAGDAGIVIDPYNINSIEKGLLKVLTMKKAEYNEMIKKGVVQAKKFSWEETARKTLKVFNNLKK